MLLTRNSILIPVTILLTFPSCVRNQSVNTTNNCHKNEGDLMNYLFANYSALPRPRKNVSQPVITRLSLVLYGIHELIERQKLLNLVTEWEDDYLSWENEPGYNCINFTIIPLEKLWYPDVAILNSENPYTAFSSNGLRALLRKDGSINFSPVRSLLLSCELDLTYFPFDKQMCNLRFESWMLPIQYERLTVDSPAFEKDTLSWTENIQWAVGTNSSKVITYKYDQDQLYYDRVVFTIELKRKSFFYMSNIILPSVVIAVAELVTFLIPAWEVTKLSISFTCLLAYSMFQTLVMADMPKTSDSLPLLIFYIEIQMASIGGVALMGQGIVLYLVEYSEVATRLPNRVLINICALIAYVLCVSHRRRIPGHAKVVPVRHTSEGEIVTVATHKIRWKQLFSENNEGDIQAAWLFIAAVINRMTCCTYVLILVLAPCVTFVAIPTLNLSI